MSAMKEVRDITKRKTGRPLSFERENALKQAMLAFWSNGYETTSIADLTKAMGVTAPSIYAAFGDKRGLFLEAARLYAGPPGQVEDAIRAAPSAIDAARDLLRSAAVLFTGEDTPPGCLLASAAASGSDAAQDIRHAVSEIRASGRAALRQRIEEDVEEGRLPIDTDAQSLADFIYATIQGMSVLARDGLKRAQVMAVADQALVAWPS